MSIPRASRPTPKEQIIISRSTPPNEPSFWSVLRELLREVVAQINVVCSQADPVDAGLRRAIVREHAEVELTSLDSRLRVMSVEEHSGGLYPILQLAIVRTLCNAD